MTDMWRVESARVAVGRAARPGAGARAACWRAAAARELRARDRASAAPVRDGEGNKRNETKRDETKTAGPGETKNAEKL